MEKKIRVLIIETHPMIIKGYISTLKNIDRQTKIFIDINNNGKNAIDNFYDILIIGINCIEEKSKRSPNNFDLGVLIRKKIPNIKILATSMLDNNYCIGEIQKRLAPNAFLIKDEITPEKLKLAFKNIIEGHTYYSKIVKDIMSKTATKNIAVDDLDIKILHYLSIGEKMKNLPKHIPLSMPSIERRKRNLKIVFEVENGGNLELLTVAKNKGFI